MLQFAEAEDEGYEGPDGDKDGQHGRGVLHLVGVPGARPARVAALRRPGGRTWAAAAAAAEGVVVIAKEVLLLGVRGEWVQRCPVYIKKVE